MEQLKAAKDKIRSLDEKWRKEEKTNKAQFEQIIRLDEKLKEMKALGN